MDDWDIKLIISSNVGGVKEKRIGGVKAGVGESEWWKVYFYFYCSISIFDTLSNPNSDSMFIVPCTISEVTDTINNLQNCKGIGLDGF